LTNQTARPFVPFSIYLPCYHFA